jgi:hypothetical protein
MRRPFTTRDRLSVMSRPSERCFLRSHMFHPADKSLEIVTPLDYEAHHPLCAKTSSWQVSEFQSGRVVWELEASSHIGIATPNCQTVNSNCQTIGARPRLKQDPRVRRFADPLETEHAPERSLLYFRHQCTGYPHGMCPGIFALAGKGRRS